MIKTDDLERMLVEITTGKPPARPDSLEEAAMRSQLMKECNEIEARGGTVEIPHEIPDVA